jgi:hypothetical protein
MAEQTNFGFVFSGIDEETGLILSKNNDLSINSAF